MTSFCKPANAPDSLPVRASVWSLKLWFLWCSGLAPKTLNLVPMVLIHVGTSLIIFLAF